MVFELTDNSLDKISADAVITFSFSDKESASFQLLDQSLGGYLSEITKEEDFKGNVGDCITVYTHKKILASKVYILGLGKKEEFNQNTLRKVLGMFSRSFKKKLASVALSPLTASECSIHTLEQGHIISEALTLGSYGFYKYKSKDPKEKEKNLEDVIVALDKKDHSEFNRGVEQGTLYAQATILARDLVNEQSAVATPTFLAQLAQDIAKKNKEVKCTVFDEKQSEKMGFHAFLGIARAADTPPRFVVLEYTPNPKSKKKVAIVGKAITFDSGGINVKTGNFMSDMKMDMSGAATVLGIFSVITKIKPNVNVIGVFAATPNMISGKSLVPGDVVKAYNGKTIEVLDTDAEGRVTLADALSYVVKEGATEIIDLATLTGACMVALGNSIAGLFTNDETLKEKFCDAAKTTGEKVWELPLEQDYKDMNKSEVADIANIPNSRYGGAITAGLFLEEFVDGKPWIHLDIAGPAFSDKPFELGPKGGTGFGVRSLLTFLESL